jgi:hypothetical protein
MAAPRGAAIFLIASSARFDSAKGAPSGPGSSDLNVTRVRQCSTRKAMIGVKVNF